MVIKLNQVSEFSFPTLLALFQKPDCGGLNDKCLKNSRGRRNEQARN